MPAAEPGSSVAVGALHIREFTKQSRLEAGWGYNLQKLTLGELPSPAKACRIPEVPQPAKTAPQAGD